MVRGDFYPVFNYRFMNGGRLLRQFFSLRRFQFIEIIAA
jgi:hypothetical protein